MAKYNAHIERFNVGEFSNAALNRIDLEKTRLAAEIQENIFPHKIGKGQVRPGTTYLGRTRNDRRARLQGFARSPSDKALLELTDGYLRVWVDDALVTRPTVNAKLYRTSFAYASTGYGFTISGAYVGNENTEGGYVDTNTPGVEHAVNIHVTKGPILFKMGTQSNKDDIIAETSLSEGRLVYPSHHLARSIGCSPIAFRARWLLPTSRWLRPVQWSWLRHGLRRILITSSSNKQPTRYSAPIATCVP